MSTHLRDAIPERVNSPNPRCRCDHLGSEHMNGRGRCKRMVLDRESVHPHLCRCSEFHPAEDPLAEALAIVNNTTLLLPRVGHLEAVLSKCQQVEEQLKTLQQYIAESVFFARVAENYFGEGSTVICDGCDRERAFTSFSVREAANALQNEGWETDKSGNEWKLVCAHCYRQGNY